MNLKQKLSKKLKKTGGFTLIEMLIVVAIIAILVAVSIPMVNSSLDKARTATDDANERAAKAAAMATFMLLDSTPTGTTDYCYDAKSGKILDRSECDTITDDYGQGSTNDAGTREGHVHVAVTKDGVATTTWSGEKAGS